jgi:hypothetical protein
VDVGFITAVETSRLKWLTAGSGADRCRWDRLRQLEEKLKNALKQIEELKQKNKGQ